MAQDGNSKTSAKFPDWNSRSRTPEPRLDYQTSGDQTNNGKSLKRPFSPNGDPQSGTGGKNPRMMILKQGEGPALGKQGLRLDGNR